MALNYICFNAVLAFDIESLSLQVKIFRENDINLFLTLIRSIKEHLLRKSFIDNIPQRFLFMRRMNR